MDTLHLVPVMLLGLVGVWLLWPVIVDPISRSRERHRLESPSGDGLADDLFNVWNAHREKTGLIDPIRKG